MDLVVDANVIFAALLKDGTTRRILTLYTLDNLNLYAPPTLIEEVLKYKPYLAKKTGMPKEKISVFFNDILEVADIQVPEKRSLKPYIKEAKSISPDPSDYPYFAVALKMKCGIWSNEVKLKQQERIKVINTKEILEILSTGQLH